MKRIDRVRRLVHRPLLMLIVALLALYALSYHGFTGTVIDEAMMMGVTAQIVDAHSVALNPFYPALESLGAPTSDPTHPIYSKYPLGQSLIAVPLYALARLIPIDRDKLASVPGGLPFIPVVPLLAMLLSGALITALTVLGIFGAARTLGASDRSAALIGVLYGATTLAWPYAKTFFNEPSTACALVWSVFFAIRYRREWRARDGMAAGLCLGAAILFRTTSLVLVPIVLLYWLPCLRNWLLPAIGIGAGVLLTLGYNAYRFGSITETGYEPGFGRAPWEALLGYLIAPSRSVFLYDPILLLAIPGAWLLARKFTLPRETLLLIALALAPIGLYATWWAWDGGESLGARFLLPSIALAILLIVPMMESARWRAAVIALGLLGFAVQLLANLPSIGDVYTELFDVRGLSASDVNWHFGDSILANLWGTYTRHRIDSVVLRLIPATHPLLAAALFAIVSGILVGVMTRAARRLGSKGTGDFPEEQPDDPPPAPIVLY